MRAAGVLANGRMRPAGHMFDMPGIYDSRHQGSAVINALYVEHTPEGYGNSSIAMQTPKVPDSNLGRITFYPIRLSMALAPWF